MGHRVEAQDFVEFVDPGQVPAGVIVADQGTDFGGRSECGEDLLVRHEFDKVGIPLAGVVLILIARQPFALEEVNQREQLSPGLGIEGTRIVGFGIEQQ